MKTHRKTQNQMLFGIHPTVLMAILVYVTSSASGALVGYVNNPTTNSEDWTAAIVTMKATINNNINFDTHPTGPLQSDFYLVSDGVSLTAPPDVSNILFDAGPGQGNTSSTPLSQGEGLHPVSNYLFDGAEISKLTITFDTSVLGAGLFVIDYFNPSDNNPLVIEAFTGPHGTGSSLGSFNSVAFNFQKNNLYFMGLLSDERNIRSFVFTDASTNTGDTMGIDNIVFAIPEPATICLLGLGGLALIRRKRRS